MQKLFGTSARLGLGFAVLLAIGCGGSSHMSTDARDASSGDGKAGTGGMAGSTAGTGGGTAGATAGASGSTAGTDGGAAGSTAGASGTDGGTAGATAGSSGTDGGTAGATAGSSGTDGGTAGASGTDGGTAGATAGSTGTDAGTAGASGGSAGTDAGTAGAAGTDAAAGAAGSDAAAGAAGSDAAVSDAGDGGADADAGCPTVCTIGAKRCAGGGVETCALDSNSCPAWGAAVLCGTHSACVAAGGSASCQCNATTCTAVGQFCSGGNTRTNCAQDGDGCFYATGAAVACGIHTTCTGAAGSATCECNVDPQCPNDTTTFCASTSSKSVCGKDLDGCFYVASTTTCPTHTSCTGSSPNGACTCDAAPPGCTTGAAGTFCSNSNGSVTTCLADTNGCVYIDHASNCGTHQTCGGTAGSQACACNAAPSSCPGGGVGDACVAGSSVHCGLDAQNCVYVTGTTACTANETCNGSSGVCECNPDPTGCTATGTFCSGGGLTTCATDAHGCHTISAGPTACPSANQTCQGSLPSAACVCNAPPAICSVGAGTYCSSANQVTTCTADAQSCVTASATVQTCGTHQSCGGTTGANRCVCNATDASCTGNGTFCAGTGAQSTCTVDGDNCPYVSVTAASCPVHQSCKGTGLGTSCSCDNTCSAAQAGGTGHGTYCTSLTTVSNCDNDANGCHLTSNDTACTGTRQCQGADGSAACLCRPVGTTEGTGCTSAGTTSCQGDAVLTCTADGTGCNIWVITSDCTTAGHVCGNASGVYACQCPAHTGTAYYVDTNLGSDGGSGLFATGINSPADCRFKTLGKGLSKVASGGSVVATDLSGTATFSGESFPLNVGANVTLTTADGTHNPASYVIAYGGASSAVSLGAGAKLEGFTISNGAGSGTAVSVAGAGATITHVSLAGTGGTTLATGIDVSGSTNAAIDNTTVTGFSTGLQVSTTSASATTLTSSTIKSSFDGISLLNGTLTTTGSTVTSNTDTGIIIATAPGTIATLNATTLTVTSNANGGILQSSTGGTGTLNFTSGDVSANTNGGILQAAGTATLGAVDIHGNTGGGTGSGVRMSGGTMTLAGTTVRDNAVRGLSVSGGTLTVGTSTIKTNGTDGLLLSGGTATINTGTSFSSNGTSGAGTGINSAGALTLGGSAASPISVATNANDGISLTAGSLTANYVTLDGNGTGAAKGAGLKIAGAAVVSLGTASDAAVLIQNNLANGINIATLTSGQVDLRKATVQKNTGDGILADFNPSGSLAQSISGMTITNNTQHGVQIVRAPLVASAIKVTLDGLNVTSNGPTPAVAGKGIGVYLNGLTTSGGLGAVGVTLKNSKIQSNKDVGLRMEGLATNVITHNIQTNDISGNGGIGVVIGARNTMNGFLGNTIHSNTGDQISLTAAPASGSFSFHSPIACDATINKVYCYGTGVGIRNASGSTVDIGNMGWANVVPTAGTDYVNSGALSAVTNGAAPTAPCGANACP
jgi:hypothetical protein